MPFYLGERSVLSTSSAAITIALAHLATNRAVAGVRLHRVKEATAWKD